MKDKYLSVEHEPALFHGPCEPDPSEQRAAPTGPATTEEEWIRDHVAEEPALGAVGDSALWGRWYLTRRQQCSLDGNLSVGALAILVTGPFAIIGAFAVGHQSIFAIIYAVIFAPIIEELLKQSGMVYLLEKKPYRIMGASQFILAGAISGLVFATIENLVYIYVYGPASGVDVAQMAAYRWPVCTALHVTCSIIASTGLIRSWSKMNQTMRPAQLSHATGGFTAAMVLHGAYNLIVTLFVVV